MRQRIGILRTVSVSERLLLALDLLLEAFCLLAGGSDPVLYVDGRVHRCSSIRAPGLSEKLL